MSWFDSIVNTVKTVSKAISDVAVSTIDPNFAALPFKDEVRSKPNDATSSDDINNEFEEENGQEDLGEGTSQGASAASLRITTRARITYELDRYRCNAMLIFIQIQSTYGCRIGSFTIREVAELMETFMNFRFEVDCHKDLTCSEIDAKCQEFFQRDFRKYGAVAVVVLTFSGETGKLGARDDHFSESIILRHYTDSMNPTLLGKPKIYITEANRSGPVSHIRHQPPLYSLPIEEHHKDILGLHIPIVIHELARPSCVMQFCDKINKMAGSHDFVTILRKFVEDATRTNSFFSDMIPIGLTNTFTKEMLLARS